MPIVDLAFSIQGSTIPVDHGYALFSAISRIVPEVHGNQGIGIHPIRGMLPGDKQVHLTRSSRMIVRLDSDDIKLLLPLAGKSLSLDGDTIHLGVPQIFLLKSVANLNSRLVTIKGFQEPETFQEALNRQLQELDVKPKVFYLTNKRSLRIQDKRVVGFGLQLIGLTAEESLRVQENGLGGRRRFGCGVFVRLRG